MAETDPQTKTITIKNDEYQVHVAPWANDAADEPKHLHMQRLSGGAGRILHFDDPEARALAKAHPELAGLGYSSDADEREASAQQASSSAEEERIDAIVKKAIEARDAGQPGRAFGQQPPRDQVAPQVDRTDEYAASRDADHAAAAEARERQGSEN